MCLLIKTGTTGQVLPFNTLQIGQHFSELFIEIYRNYFYLFPPKRLVFI